MQQIEKDAGKAVRGLLRIVAAIVGVVGAIVALIVDLVNSGVHDLLNASGVTTSHTHGFIGFLLVILGVIGAIVALFGPRVGGVLMILAGLGFIFIVGWFAFIASPLLIIAGIIAFFDKPRSQAA